MATKNRKADVEPVTLDIDINQAKSAFERLEPEFKSLREDERLPIRVDVQRAAAIAHSVAVRDTDPARRDRFARLAGAGFFEIEVLDQLRASALAAWYARSQQLRFAELSSDARLPESVLRQATEVRGRMLRVLDHYFEGDAQLSATLTLIHRGTGYMDLANDLLSLIELYERDAVQSLISRDPMHYRESDVADARTHAQTIFRALGLSETDEARRWSTNAQCAWTLLLRAYERTRAAAGLLFQAEEDVAVTYPSLVTATRSAVPSRRAANPTTPPTTPETTTPAEQPTP